MWDSKALNKPGEAAPILRADLEQRVPFGFHSTFVDEKDYRLD